MGLVESYFPRVSFEICGVFFFRAQIPTCNSSVGSVGTAGFYQHRLSSSKEAGPWWNKQGKPVPVTIVLWIIKRNYIPNDSYQPDSIETHWKWMDKLEQNCYFTLQFLSNFRNIFSVIYLKAFHGTWYTSSVKVQFSIHSVFCISITLMNWLIFFSWQYAGPSFGSQDVNP